MTTCRRWCAWLAVCLTLCEAAPSQGGEPVRHDASTEAPAYRATLSDVMGALIQPRHIRLWLAGKTGDWALAAYEAQVLGGAFGRVAAAFPAYHGQAMTELVATFLTPGLVDVQAAISAHDAARFVAAYQTLTTGCGACHVATGHAAIVIKVPGDGAMPDQAFGAAQE